MGMTGSMVSHRLFNACFCYPNVDSTLPGCSLCRGWVAPAWAGWAARWQELEWGWAGWAGIWGAMAWAWRQCIPSYRQRNGSSKCHQRSPSMSRESRWTQRNERFTTYSGHFQD